MTLPTEQLPAWHFTRFVKGQEMAEGICVHAQSEEDAVRKVARLAYKNETAVYILRSTTPPSAGEYKELVPLLDAMASNYEGHDHICDDLDIQALRKAADTIRTLIAREERLHELVRLFPEAHDILTRQELKDTKGNWRSLIDQQISAVKQLRAALNPRSVRVSDLSDDDLEAIRNAKGER